MVKRCGVPRGRAVAGLARGGEARLAVIRVRGAGIVALVALNAVGGCTFKAPICVAGDTANRQVCAGQRVPGELRVIKLRIKSGVEAMALLALRGES